MNQLIERVAKALFDDWLADYETQKDVAQNGPHPRWEDQGEIGRRRFCSAARAAIEAMREPTEEMLIAGGERPYFRGNTSEGAMVFGEIREIVAPENIYTAMIDAALKDIDTTHNVKLLNWRLKKQSPF